MSKQTAGQTAGQRNGGLELLVTQVRSGIGRPPAQRRTLQALGLGRIGKSRTLPDRPEIRGMLFKVSHLVSVKETAAAPKGQAKAAKEAATKEKAAQ